MCNIYSYNGYIFIKIYIYIYYLMMYFCLQPVCDILLRLDAEI